VVGEAEWDDQRIDVMKNRMEEAVRGCAITNPELSHWWIHETEVRNGDVYMVLVGMVVLLDVVVMGG